MLGLEVVEFVGVEIGGLVGVVGVGVGVGVVGVVTGGVGVLGITGGEVTGAWQLAGTAKPGN